MREERLEIELAKFRNGIGKTYVDEVMKRINTQEMCRKIIERRKMLYEKNLKGA
jgi:hypothetical protein